MPRRPPLVTIAFIVLVGSMVRPASAGETVGWLLAPDAVPEDRTAAREAYLPQPGDILLYSHKSFHARFFYTLAHTGKPYHAGVVVNLPDGRPGVLEAGPYDYIGVYLMDLAPRLRSHDGLVWVRRRGRPLDPDQSARLTAFALEQTDKRFALFRIILEATPFRAHGPVRACLRGSSRVDRRCWFCSELVVAALAVASVVDPHTMKPNTVYPRDLFLDRPFDLSPCWEKPRLWTCDP